MKVQAVAATVILPGAMGVPTLDGLGVAGDKYHTLEEHIEIDSLAMRGKMMAGLLMGIDQNF
jgi:glutamate carboxypeptidase